MQIVHELPPFYGEIADAVGVPPIEAVFTHGHTVYKLTDGILSLDLAVHELMHIKQQADLDGGPDAWWHAWIDDPVFRLDQELAAYRTQYQFNSLTLEHSAKSLSSLYGLKLRLSEARRLISDTIPHA